MFNNFGVYVAKILKEMEKERSKLKHPFVGSEHLLLSLLKNDSKVISIMKKNNIDYDIFRKELVKIVSMPKKNVEFNLYTPLLKRVLANSFENAQENNNGKVTTTHLIISILDEGEGVAIRILMGLNVDLDKLYEDFQSNKIAKNEINVSSGKILNEVVDINEKTIGREKEINLIIETLFRKKKNNPLLVGDAGVGKTAIVEELARRIVKKQVPRKLLNMKIVNLEMSSLVAGTKYRGEFEEKLTKLIEEITSNKNIILFIDEIHTMINAGGAEGAISAGDILKPYLARSDIKCIGATTTYEYEKYLTKDKALCRRFENIQVLEPSIKETETILNCVKEEYEFFHNIKISKNNIKEIVDSAQKYMQNKKNPDKSLDLLDTVCSYINIKYDKTTIDNLLSDKLNLIKTAKEKYIEENNFSKACIYKNKENILKNKIEHLKKENKKIITSKDIRELLVKKLNNPYINNNNLKSNITEELTQINLENNTISKILNMVEKKVEFPEKNIYVLLKKDPKEKNVLNILENSFENTIKLNGLDYVHENSLSKLVGNTYGYSEYENNYIFNKIKYNRYTVILIENYNVMNEKIKKLFNTIKDAGYITDCKGEKIDFGGSLLFATTEINKESSLGFVTQKKNEIEHINLTDFDEIIELEYVLDIKGSEKQKTVI